MMQPAWPAASSCKSATLGPAAPSVVVAPLAKAQPAVVPEERHLNGHDHHAHHEPYQPVTKVSGITIVVTTVSHCMTLFCRTSMDS